MPKSTVLPGPKRAGAPAGEPFHIDDLCEHADALFRAARECCSQRQCYARLVEAGVSDQEQRDALSIVVLCDQILTRTMDAYEKAAARAPERETAEWWHRANMLWLAGREYLRHHDDCDRVSRRLGQHSPGTFGQLAVEYDLEASALLALRHAIDAYCRVRPEADLSQAPRSPIT